MKLNNYRLIFNDGSECLIKAATKKGAQLNFIRKHGMRRLQGLKFVDLVESEEVE